MTAAQIQANEEKMLLQVLNYLRVVARRKRLIAAICLTSAILSALYSLTLPSVYSATVKVLPPQKEAGGITSMLSQMGGLAMLAGAGRGGIDSELYLGILRSRSVGETVIQRLGLTGVYRVGSVKQAWAQLEHSVKAQVGKDGIIAITAEAPEAKLSAQLANTYADELGRTLVRLNISKAGSEKLFLEKRLEVVKQDLKRAEDDLKNFSQQSKIVRLEAQAGASVSGVVRLKAEIANKEVQLAVLRNSQTDASPDVQALKAAVNRLRAELSRAAGNSSGGEPVPAIGSVPQVGLEYARKLRELKVQEAIFEQLSKQYELAKLNYAKDSSSLQILDEAVVPDLRSRPRRSVLVLMSTLVAFLGSVLMVLGLEFLERLPNEEREALQHLKRQALSFK
ncbi:hypothetical protein GMST_16730 [Geomonas silvestris]|uniref:Polysaccharide chain length determinant protein n=1 Tax=Geomonas silvestris TaxID=2740184 RepID=A0A6V8MH92_9BACT|nr:Wzz/FepE/Etk N-terminal domain-containing protein [Geomonas silvestris]GFO59348.1 hypothetical protein GMST_16730 [Geomonas silvestris]